MFRQFNESFKKTYANVINEGKECSNEFDYTWSSLEEDDLDETNPIFDEAMSPEDEADTKNIRSMIHKMNTRANAKFSPEEQATMDKYGMERNNSRRTLTVDDRDIQSRVDFRKSRLK